MAGGDGVRDSAQRERQTRDESTRPHRTGAAATETHTETHETETLVLLITQRWMHSGDQRPVYLPPHVV